MPHVVIHVAVSLDGATTGFEADVARFYALAAGFHEDVTLAGADTILAQAEALAREGPARGPTGRCSRSPTGARGSRSGCGARCARPGHWRDAVAGALDLPAALAGFEGVVRVDSGGALNGALLRAGLVDEISLLVHPVLVGDAPRWYGSPPPGPLHAHAARGRRARTGCGFASRRGG